MSKYRVTMHRENGSETIWPSFVVQTLPYPGLLISHQSSEWVVKKVRLHVRGDDSMAAKREDPHLVDVIVEKSAGLFT
jgi:hypothetical protein